MPFPYKRILCPVDFDQHSADALNEAAMLALNSGGELLVLHVVHINPLTYQGAAEGFAAGEMFEEQTEFARKQVEQMLTTIPAQVKHDVTIYFGEPGDGIKEAETKLNPDLVVMATHGRTGLRHIALGSVAERIVRESVVPVLTVRPQKR